MTALDTVGGVKALLVLVGVGGAVLALLVLGARSRTPAVAVTVKPQAPTTTASIELAAVDPAQWARFRRQANDVCAEAQRHVQRQLDRVRDATVPEQVFVSLERTLGVQQRTIVRLTRVKRPVGLEARIQRFLSVLREQLADDRRLVRKIKDETITVRSVERAQRRDERRIARVGALATEIGVAACSRYVDYDFYG